MKKILLLMFSTTALLFSVFVFTGCSGCSSEYDADTKDLKDSSLDSDISDGTCLVIAESIVEKKMTHPDDVDFERLSAQITNLGGNEYKVLQKFNAKNDYGVTVNYIYRIRLVYNGGDKYDDSSWSISELTIENVNTGERFQFEKSTKKTNKNNISKKGDVLGKMDGINFKIVEETSQAIRLSTSKKINVSQMKKIKDEFHLPHDLIQFCAPNKLQRGEEYAQIDATYIFLFDEDTIISLK